MGPIGRETGGGIAQRGRSLIYTITLFYNCRMTIVIKRICYATHRSNS